MQCVQPAIVRCALWNKRAEYAKDKPSSKLMHVLFDGNSANEDVVCSFVLLTSWMRVQNVVCAFVESTDCIIALMGGGHRVVFCLPYS